MAGTRPSGRAYVDTPVREFEAARHAAERAASAWSLPSPERVRIGMNAIFRAGDVALRVSKPTVDASVSIDLARFWNERGVSVPAPVEYAVVVDRDLSVTAWEWIEPSDEPIDWEAVGAAVRAVHATAADDLPSGVPLPSPASFPWWDFDALFARTATRLDDPARAGLEAMVERHREWADFESVVVCHGDVHPGNVLMTDRGPLVIDWDLLCLAPPGWDHGPMMTWERRWGGHAGEYAAYAAGYGHSFVDDPAAVAFAELRLVAATLMRVAAAEHDPSAGVEAERRLRYWRGDADAPAWAAQ